MPTPNIAAATLADSRTTVKLAATANASTATIQLAPAKFMTDSITNSYNPPNNINNFSNNNNHKIIYNSSSSSNNNTESNMCIDSIGTTTSSCPTISPTVYEACPLKTTTTTTSLATTINSVKKSATSKECCMHYIYKDKNTNNSNCNNGLLASDEANDNVVQIPNKNDDNNDEDNHDQHNDHKEEDNDHQGNRNGDINLEDHKDDDDADDIEDNEADNNADDQDIEADHHNEDATDHEEDYNCHSHQHHVSEEDEVQQTSLPSLAGDLILTHEQHDFHLEGDINELPDILHANNQKLTGEFAYFYPYDGSEPSLLLIGKDFYINVTPQQQSLPQQDILQES